MESLPEKCLSVDEKAKLKERLALLKKEYKRTVNRLQRSQRAERVKSHVKKTIEEQNRLLSQEYASITSTHGSAGLVNSTNNTSGAVGESQESTGNLTVDKHRKLSVSFNLEPDVLPADGRSPPCSGGESSGWEADASNKDEGSGTHKPEQRARSRLRLSRSLKRACVSESPTSNVVQLDSIASVLENQQVNMVAERSGSPVFQKCLQEDVPSKNDAAVSLCLESRKAIDLCPEVGDGLDARTSLVTTTDSPDGPINNVNTDEWSSLATAKEPLHSHLDKVYNRLETKHEQPLHATKCLEVVDVEDRPRNDAETSSSVHDNHLQSSDSRSLANFNAHGDEQNPLTSCTLVEGLIFPVEYYVRTTRRMTSCQRKVDINAVINSHLGLARRGRPRQRSASLSLLAGNDSLSTFNSPPVISRTAEVKWSKRRQGRKSCPAEISSSGLEDVAIQLEFGSDPNQGLNGFQSEKENCEEETPSRTALDKEESHCANITENIERKEVLKIQDSVEPLQSDRKVYSLRPRGATSLRVQTSPNNTEDFEINPYVIRTSKEEEEGKRITGSPFPRFSGTVSLEHLLCRLDITDFHLPDEEFGVLKLEKLKSMSHLESYAPKPTKGRRRCSRTSQRDTGQSVTTCGPLGVSRSSSGHDLKLLTVHKDCMNDEPSIDSQENNVENNISLSIEASKHDLVVSQAGFNSDPINALKLSPVISGPIESNDETSNFLSSCVKHLFPLDRSPEVNLDAVRCSTDEKICSTDVLSKISEPIPFSTLYLDGRNVSLRGTDVLEKLPQPENHPVSSTSVEPNVGPKAHPETDPLGDRSPKKLTCSVLFSTSICSVPLESIDETVAPDCTPQYPFLGATPAVFSSPLSTNTRTGENINLKTRVSLLEAPGEGEHSYKSMDSEETTVTLREMDSGPCSGIMPLSEGLSQACDNTVVHQLCQSEDYCGKKPEVETREVNEDGEVHESANRLDCDNAEERPLGGGHLRCIAEIQDTCGGGCAVDLCSVWWEFSGCTELCIMSASESSISLWRPQAAGKWKCAHTWSFIEIPVIQMLPLSQEKNMACVALGNLEIMEIWVLFSHPDKQNWEKKLVKSGPTKTAHGLSRLRVVSSGGVGEGQVVEVTQLLVGGSTLGSLTLTAPQDTILAFSEVDGERDALVGSTVDNNLVIWNSVTGHLLSRIYIGDLCSDIVCLRATSDAGLLFLVVGSLFGKHRDTTSRVIFRLIAANPCEGASALVMSYPLPERLISRYLEGDVSKQSAAAVLTCGSIALWDLPRNHCSAMLPPSSDSPWCLVRWSHNTSCLMTGRKDGTIFVYEHTDPYSNKTRDELKQVVQLKESLGWLDQDVSQARLDGHI